MKYLLLVIVILFSSCGVKKTNFKLGNLPIGTEVNDVISRYGNPFTDEIYYDSENNKIQVFCYKELVDLSYETYVLNTYLFFTNNKLTSFKQSTEVPPSKVNLLENR